MKTKKKTIVGDREKERDVIANEMADIVGITFYIGLLLFILRA